MREISIILTLVLLLPHALPAQTIVLERDTRRDTISRQFGKNYRHYVYATLSGGFIAGPTEAGLPVQFGNSNYLGLGAIYKYKLNGYWALGAGADYSAARFRLREDSTKTFPTATLHDKERFSMSFLSFSGFVRYNFDGKRGNNMGKFIDLGGALNIFTQIEHETFNRDPLTGQQVQTIRTNLGYTNDFAFTAFARAGLYNLMLYFAVRLTPVFDPSKVSVDLPALRFGLTIGIH